MIDRVQRAVVEAPAAAAMYGGAGSALTFWGLNLSEIGVIVSAFVAVLGFAAQIWLGLRRDRRERALYARQMETLNDTVTGSAAGKEARVDQSSSPPSESNG